MATIGQRKASQSKTGTYTSKSGTTYYASGKTSTSGGSSSMSAPVSKDLNLYNTQTGALLNPGETYTNAQGQKVTQGTPFSLDTTKPVQSEKLGQPQIPVAPSPIAPDYTGTVTQALGTVTPIEPTEQSIQQSATDRFDKFLASQKEAPNLMEIQNKLEKQNQIQAKQEKVNTYQTQLNSIVAKAQADVLGTQGLGRGIPEAIIGGQQAQINKEAAIQALPIQALLSSAQGDLQTAQSHVDKLFGIYAQDAENQVKFFNDQSKLVYDFATKQEQQQLDRLNEQKKFEQNILVSKMDAQQSYATEALKNGNITLFNRLTAIQPPTNVNSPSYKADLASYEQKVNSAVAKYGSYGTSAKAPNVVKINGTDMIWDGSKFVPAPVGGGGTGSELQQAQLQSNVDQIDNVLNNKALKSTVGTSLLSRGSQTVGGTIGRFLTGAIAGGATGALAGAPFAGVGAIPGAIGGALIGGTKLASQGLGNTLTGAKQNFIADVDQLSSGLTLTSLINAKANGATFGALSEGELKLLSNTGTKLNKWAIKDSSGNTLGYNASEKDFKTELDKIKSFAVKDAIIKGSTPEAVGAKTMADGTVWFTDSFGNLTQIR